MCVCVCVCVCVLVRAHWGRDRFFDKVVTAEYSDE